MANKRFLDSHYFLSGNWVGYLSYTELMRIQREIDFEILRRKKRIMNGVEDGKVFYDLLNKPAKRRG